MGLRLLVMQAFKIVLLNGHANHMLALSMSDWPWHCMARTIQCQHITWKKRPLLNISLSLKTTVKSNINAKNDNLDRAFSARN